MKRSPRSYPHPVVGNRDDVADAAFAAEYKVTTDSQNLYVEVSINCTSATVNELLASNGARFIAHVECSNTMYRRALEFTETTKRIQIPADQLNDSVEVNVFACTIHPKSGYRPEKAHGDYADTVFDVRKGDVLAVANGFTFDVESQFDALARIGSIMQIEEAKEDGDMAARVEFGSDKILIRLCKNEFTDYKLLRSQDIVSPALACAIVLPVLLEALTLVDGSDYDGYRWVKSIRRRLAALGLEKEQDRLVRAQKLLELPLRRALVAARKVTEGFA